MSDKTITLSLGGQDRVLDFGTFRFTKHYQRLIKGKDITDAENLEAMLVAGLKASYGIEKKPEDFTTSDVEDWLSELSNEKMKEIENQIIGFLKVDVPGERKAPVSGA